MSEMKIVVTSILVYEKVELAEVMNLASFFIWNTRCDTVHHCPLLKNQQKVNKRSYSGYIQSGACFGDK